jgi:hypothetical protein
VIDFKEEIWKDIERYEGLYQVSNLGRVKSLSRLDTLGRKVKGCILKFLLHSGGYTQVTLYRCGAKKFFIHRLTALAFIPNFDNKSEINHKNGIKVDNRVENLEWATSFENKRHRIDVLGILVDNRGEKSGMVKLTKVDVLQIRESGLKCRELAVRYNVNPSHISRIKSSKRWGHI